MPDIPLWPQCNMACVFCSNPTEGYRHAVEQYSYEQIKRKILGYKNGEYAFLKFNEVRDCCNLTGGEPTIHPDFLKVLALIRAEFPKNMIRILTNGRMFGYENFARWTLRLGQYPFEIAIPLCGYDARTHEAISRTPKSFDQTVRGLQHIRRFRKPEQKVEIRIILTRIQLRYLDGLLDFVLSEFPWIDRLVFLFVEMEGFARRYANVLNVTMSECGTQLDRNYGKLMRFREVRLYHFPLCTLPPRLWPLAWNTLAPFKVTFMESCRAQCVYKPQCVGVHRSYERELGAPDIRPITQPLPVGLCDDPYHPIRSFAKEF